MSQLLSRCLARLQRLTLAAACATLTGCVALAWAIAAVPAYSRHAMAGLAALAAAAAVCHLSSTAALIVAWSLRGTAWAAQGLLAGTFIRMAIPLSVAVAAQMRPGPLARSGLAGWILVFFLLTLVVETVLVLGVASQPLRAGSKLSSKVS